jgi:hypothetical protein
MVSASTAEIVLDIRRELTFRSGDSTRKGELHIEKIAYFPDRQCWGCFWSISFIRPSSRQPIYGEDPLQALTLSLSTISALLRESSVRDMDVWWLAEGDKGGFQHTSDETPTI